MNQISPPTRPSRWTTHRLDPFQDLADEFNIAILVGSPIRSTIERPFIGMLIFRPSTAVLVYRKRFVHSSETPYFVASNEQFVFDWCEEAICPAICADVNNPQHADEAARLGATVYAAGVAVTKDEIQKSNGNMNSHAKRHGMISVLSNYAETTGGFDIAGRSAIWDHHGKLIAQAEPRGECLVVARRNTGSWSGAVYPVTP